MHSKKIFQRALFAFILVGSCFIQALAVASETIALINTPVANMYAKSDSNSPVVSQAIYYTKVTVLQTQKGFSLIQTPDNYQGWVDKRELFKKAPIPNARIVQVKNLFANIYQDASTTNHQPLLVVPFGTQLPLIAVIDDRWIKVQMVNGVTGWIQQGDADIDPKPISMQEMLALSRSFIGIPYLWGGVSAFGLDCSGFVQMLFRQMGIFLPRDNVAQVYWPGFIEVSSKDLRPGDVLYFGWDNKVSHTGIYLGNNKFISETAHENPIVQVSDINLPHWKSIFIVARRLDTSQSPEFSGSITPIPENVKLEMRKYSWHPDCPIPLENLSYLTMSYWGFDNKPHQGTMIVHNDVAQEVLDIFKELYYGKYPIEKMQPIDAYKANDNASMVANNTSAFSCRTMTDYPDQYSPHSYGKAIDVNPLINPYVNNGKVEPVEGAKYQDRATYDRGKIIRGSKIYELFTAHGWVWGGDWEGALKDYQHFEKPITK